MQVPLFSLELPMTLAYWRDIFKRNSSVETSCILMQIPLSHLKPNPFSFFPILFLSFSRQKENIFDDLSFHETNSLEELHMYIYITIYIHTQYTQRWVFSLFNLSFFFCIYIVSFSWSAQDSTPNLLSCKHHFTIMSLVPYSTEREQNIVNSSRRGPLPPNKVSIYRTTEQGKWG